HGVITLVPTFKDWSDFSTWYENLIAGRHTATPLIRSTAGRITSEAGTDFFAKVAAAGKFVRDGVRYVAVELGIAGFQPKPADETLSGLLGDCKDKTTLFRALLAALEIPSYAILVNLSRENTVMERLPVYGFNHLIAAVHLPDGIEIPSSFSPAIMDAGDMGQLLIVDTTDEKTSVGSPLG